MKTTYNQQTCTTAIAADGAVGVPKKHWFVAIVNHNSERKCDEELRKNGYETYTPIQEEMRLSSRGKRHIVHRVVIPCLIFIHATEKERREVVRFPFIYRFMTNRSGRTDEFNRHPIATIPNEQMEWLKFMLYHSEEPVEVQNTPPNLGDRVRVTRGSLQGLEGNVVRTPEGKDYIVILLGSIGCAKVKINLTDLEVISENFKLIG